MDLDQIDAERRGPMAVAVAGKQVSLAPATELSWRHVVLAASDDRYFGALVWPADVRLPFSKLGAVREAWRRHNALPDVGQMRRLVYMFERYYEGIEYDLRDKLGLSAGELWRERRWRELLGYIDRFPANTHMNRMLSLDEEHMQELLKNEKGDPGPKKPSMADWSLTNELLSTLIDAVNKNTAVNQGIANPKGPKPRIDPMPRPASVAEKIRLQLQKDRHQEMVGLLLPGRVS